MLATKQTSILYVEDDPASCRLMTLLANTLEGAKITVFDTSENFLDRIGALPAAPDVIFLDIHITPHNGYELLKMLRSRSDFKGTPVIAMTASVMATDVEELRKAGFDGLIGKPIRKKAFSEQLQKILSGDPVWVVY
jgi:two-component system cell cycle response regulator DivK